MPGPGKKWRHVILNTRSSWLHGDKRGFRSRGHRIHSSGDYRHPPPEGEHEELHDYRLRQSRCEVHLPAGLRNVIGVTMIQRLESGAHRVLAVAVTKVHAHLLVELPDNIVKIKTIVGDAKRLASRAVKSSIPGAVWARGGTYKPVESRAHQRRVYNYILYDQGTGAWTWSIKDGSEQGRFGRLA